MSGRSPVLSATILATLSVVLCAAAAAGDEQPTKANPGLSVEKGPQAERPKAEGDVVDAWMDEAVSSNDESGHRLKRNLAGKAAKDSEAAVRTDGQGTMAFLDMFWPLCVVLLVMAAIALAVRKWMPRSVRTGGSDLIEVIARQHVSGKQSVCLVRVGRRMVLMGVSPDRISTLSEITDPEEVCSLVAGAERNRPGSFTNLFSRLSKDEVETELAAGQESAESDGQLIASTDRLARTGDRVHRLVDRVRSISSGVEIARESGGQPD